MCGKYEYKIFLQHDDKHVSSELTMLNLMVFIPQVYSGLQFSNNLFRHPCANLMN